MLIYVSFYLIRFCFDFKKIILEKKMKKFDYLMTFPRRGLQGFSYAIATTQVYAQIVKIIVVCSSELTCK